MGRKAFETRLQSRHMRDGLQDECIACDKSAVGVVIIASSPFRGEDDNYKVCQRHYNMAYDNLDRFFAHINTKDKFFQRNEPEQA